MFISLIIKPWFEVIIFDSKIRVYFMCNIVCDNVCALNIIYFKIAEKRSKKKKYLSKIYYNIKQEIN